MIRSNRAPISISIQRLRPAQLPELAALEVELFPPALQLGMARLHYYLTTAEVKGRNYSAAVLDSGRMVGYVLMIDHPSDFFPGREVAYVISMAVRFRYRRAASAQLFQWILREGLLTGASIEGKMREATAFRSIRRNWRMAIATGFRITQLVEIEPIAGERLVDVRFEHHFMRDRWLWWAYRSLTWLERARRAGCALPRRSVRALARRLPPAGWLAPLRRYAYLDLPLVPDTIQFAYYQGLRGRARC